MKIREFITENYNFITAIATNEYMKDSNKVLYKNYGRDDFISEVMVFFLKKYDEYDETRCKPRTFIITSCKYCAGELKKRLNNSKRCIDLVTINESDLITTDNNDDELNPYLNIGEEDFYTDLSIFNELTPKEKTLCLYKLHGLSMKEMEKLTGVSRAMIWRYFKTIKSKLV